MDNELFFQFQLELRKPFLESKTALELITKLLEDPSNCLSLVLEKKHISLRLYRGTRKFHSLACNAALRGVCDNDRKNISFFNVAASKKPHIEILYVENDREKENPNQEFGPIWLFKVYKHPDSKAQASIERTINAANVQIEE